MNVCDTIASQYKQKIEEIIDIQVQENREAIFFIFEDGRTSDIAKGGATNISLTREQEAAFLSQGNIISSVHSHPTGFDPSTIDIMTGTSTQQNTLCVATPLHNQDIDDNFVLTCIDLSKLNFLERRRLMRAMRRSTIGISNAGRQARKKFNLERFDVEGCRTHSVEIEGVTLPLTGITIGDIKGVSEKQ